MENIILARRFQVRQLLGGGGMATTYLCRDLQRPSRKTLVLKEMRPDASRPELFPMYLERFTREAEVLEKLGEEANGRIPRLHAFFEESGRYFLVQDYVEGETLLAILKRLGKLPEGTVLSLFDDLLETLEFIHGRNIIHRDIKPDNVLVRPSNARTVLIDFGVLKEVLHDRTISTAVVGNLGYMAPEQQYGHPCFASDIYSLAVVCLQLLSGKPPRDLFDPGRSTFRIEDLSEYVDSRVLAVLRRATAPALADRFESATAAREALRPLIVHAGRQPRTSEDQQSHTEVLGSTPPIDGDDDSKTPAVDDESEIETVERGPRRAPSGRARPLDDDAAARPMAGSNPEPSAPPVERSFDICGGESVDMVLIQPGSFLMGSNNTTRIEKPVHKVTITNPYYVGKYPVTQGQWEAVMGVNPSFFKGDARLPVEQVSWEDCQEFLRKLNSGTDGKWRLLTEAEWEYACRAGSTGDYAGNLDDMAWYGNNSGRTYLDAWKIWETDRDNYGKRLFTDNDSKTHRVGTKRANGWGLYDMHGNVWEWCSDWFGAYTPSEQVDPRGPSTGSFRVDRGGCWGSPAAGCRSADRGSFSPGDRGYFLGLRLARTIGTSEITGLSVSRSTSTAQVPNRSQISVEGTPVADGGTPADQRTASLDVGAAKPSRASVNVSRIQMADMVLIQPGTFLMGSENGLDDEKPVHEVVISKPFYLGKCQVTQGQWTSLMGSNPSRFEGDAGLPVECVSWDDVQRFLTKLNARLGGGWRLPTEAEWEYACRAGTTGDYAGELSEMAWFSENSGRETHLVGTKRPNAWGLFDMHGNVWEWCSDYYDEYTSSEQVDPRGPSTGSDRVFRGGGWNRNAVGCRSAKRSNYSPGGRYNDLGLRLARTVQ